MKPRPNKTPLIKLPEMDLKSSGTAHTPLLSLLLFFYLKGFIIAHTPDGSKGLKLSSFLYFLL
jgi:hypothetical protein